jgi:hypothetical protein
MKNSPLKNEIFDLKNDLFDLEKCFNEYAKDIELREQRWKNRDGRTAKRKSKI